MISVPCSGFQRKKSSSAAELQQETRHADAHRRDEEHEVSIGRDEVVQHRRAGQLDRAEATSRTDIGKLVEVQHRLAAVLEAEVVERLARRDSMRMRREHRRRSHRDRSRRSSGDRVRRARSVSQPPSTRGPCPATRSRSCWRCSSACRTARSTRGDATAPSSRTGSCRPRAPRGAPHFASSGTHPSLARRRTGSR